MQGSRIAAALLLAPGLALATDLGITFNSFAYAQLTFEPVNNGERSGLTFGADRVRLGTDYQQGPWFGRGEVALNTEALAINEDDDAVSSRAAGSLPDLINELYAGYFIDNSVYITLGQMRTPVGMDFWIPGNELDIVKRGMDAALVLDRSLGVMVSGRQIAGFLGYDFGIFNVAGRSRATAHSAAQVGDVSAIAARVLFTAEPHLHAEASIGFSPEAGGHSESENYIVLNSAARLNYGQWVAKGEYIFGANINGDVGGDHAQTVVYLHLGYRFTDRLSAAGRVYLGSSTVDDVQTAIQNTYLGVTWHLSKFKDTHHRIQANYIVSTGDIDFWSGVGGFVSDSFFMQYQVDFDFPGSL